MRWGLLLGVAASAAVLFLLGNALKKKLFPPRCPRCGMRGLRRVTAVPTPGGRGRVDLSYHVCPLCGAKLRLKHGDWSDPPEEEWARMNPP